MCRATVARRRPTKSVLRHHPLRPCLLTFRKEAMRKSLVLVAAAVVAALAVVAVATGKSTKQVAVSASCDKASLNLVSDGVLTIGTDNPAYPPWYAGGSP